MSKEELKQQFEAVAAGYVALFLDRYFDGLETEHYWTADEVGSVLAVNDFWFGYDDIRYAVDNDVDWDSLYEWYYYSEDVFALSNGDMDVKLSSFVKGHLPYEQEKIRQLMKEKNRLMLAQAEFDDKVTEFLKDGR